MGVLTSNKEGKVICLVMVRAHVFKIHGRLLGHAVWVQGQVLFWGAV